MTAGRPGLKSFALSMMLTLLAVLPAHASTIWGLSSATPGKLYTINPTTGAATFVVDVSNSTSLVGLEWLDGQLWGSDVITGTGFRTGTIDPVTGVFTPVSTQAGSANFQGLAADRDADVLYSIAIDQANDPLYRISTAGVTTLVGPSGIVASGMAFDDVNNILYATSQQGGLYTVNTTTGAATLVGAMGIPSQRLGLAFDLATGTLLANSVNGSLGSLYRVNPLTGAAVLIGSNGVNNPGIDGLAFEPGTAAVPEPGTLLLLGTGLLAVARARRLRKSSGKS